MQTVIEVVCRGRKSLREEIKDDRRLNEYGLEVVECKRSGRNPGWTKLRSTVGASGAINIEWRESSRTLTCRVVRRNRASSDNVVGDFVRYVLARYRKRIVAVLISQAM